MPIFGLWHGGSNYSAPELTDAEIFPSIVAATDALRDRADSGHWCPQTFAYADGRTVTTLTPCASDGATMALYVSNPATTDDPYPFRLLTIGPRGGVAHQKT